MDSNEILRRHAFVYKKKYGQNFITDQNLLEAIVSDAGVGENSTVLEIGAGAGTLTRALAARAKRVISFEVDKTLRPVLEETLAGFQNVELIFGDFMGCATAAFERRQREPYMVVANLPYYLTTPIVLRFVEEAELCTSLTVMVQEEVAERFTASPGTAAYGAVTVAIARRGRARIVRRIPRTVFYPRPNVDSALVRVDFGQDLPVEDDAAFRAAVRAAFSSRRKTLENNLMGAFQLSREEAKAVLLEAGVEEGARGEILSPERFETLARVLVKRNIFKTEW